MARQHEEACKTETDVVVLVCTSADLASTELQGYGH